jgi:hypothetical protein
MSIAKVFPTSVTDQNSDYLALAYTKGQMRAEGGNLYRLAKAGATIGAKTVCMFSAYDGTANTAGGGMTVIVTTGVTVPVVGANATGASITSGNYFWMLVDGIAVITGDAALAAGEKLSPAASGAVDTYASAATGAPNVFCGLALEDSPADPYGTVCWIKASVAGNSLAA